MSYRLNQIRGLGPVHQSSLASENIFDSEQLVHVGAQPSKRRQLSVSTGIPEEELARFVSQSELMRLPGVGPAYAELLQRSGVRNLQDLARRNLDEVVQRLQGASQRRAGMRTPSNETVRRWIEDARTLVKGTAQSSREPRRR